jgi:hypothetical protein
MSYRISEKEMQSVSRLDAGARLKHFIKRVADWQEVWTLRDAEGRAVSLAAAGKEAAPFWPHPAYASACARAGWENCEPQPIALHVFMEQWLPDLAQGKQLAAVFPTPDSEGALLAPELVLQELIAECRESYGDDL